MAFCFVVGTQDFTKPLKGYEGTTAQCYNCGNWSAHPIQSWNWFTFCWVPIIPLGGKDKDVGGLLIYRCRNVDECYSLHARFADFDKTSGTGRTSNLNKLKGQMRPLHSRGLRKDGGAGLPRDSKRAINNIPRSYD